ncbi:carbonyl reductase [Actinomadura sp. NBRC 104412]|uniref:SDR family NAD(P)-dependent oxidoreductase n=1 Tax=Actinomadura sp. NBRC 104412 TaxID=3032203 RepID=UPI0024A10F5E|nr:SDR family NAD(P)-dependent oxidoreductase [Actinomadura sp. NBRC 104412]GLZ02960.1 carbonyl reductase [Actinomadura sp. NBRC 104412]
MTSSKVALVTGANQGIGYALVEELARRWREEDVVLLTGRDPSRVREAAARVGGRARVEGRRLDVTDAGAIAKLADELGERHGGVDVVISNAGARITPDRPQEEQIDEFVAVANGGAHAMLRSFGPVLRAGGRLIVVASSLGTLGHLDERVHPLFDDLSLEGVEALTESWRTAVHQGTAQQRGWPQWINIPSKVLQVAAVRAVARERRDADLRDGTLVAAVCPGLVDTEASRPWFSDFSRAWTPAQAAERLLDFVLAEPVDPAMYGELVRTGTVLPWRGRPYVPAHRGNGSEDRLGE